ncbi:MAG: hypothetical protein ACE5F1_00955 [Planctomycetota bacterium]
MSRKDIERQKGRNARRAVRPIPEGQPGAPRQQGARTKVPWYVSLAAGIIVPIYGIVNIPAFIWGMWAATARWTEKRIRRAMR